MDVTFDKLSEPVNPVHPSNALSEIIVDELDSVRLLKGQLKNANAPMDVTFDKLSEPVRLDP
jgi:aryl carrier-like protein